MSHNTTGAARATLALLAALAAPATAADKQAGAPSPWSYTVTGYYNNPKGQSAFGSAIGIAQRDELHLEARYNYEALDTGSIFAGWKFSTGDALKIEATPIIGAIAGKKNGVAPGLEFSAAWKALDFYSEIEYVYDLQRSSDSYLYSWNELGVRPVSWLRAGIAAQRTRLYQGTRDIQRGPFVQASLGPATLSVYVFNPGTNDRLVVTALGLSF